MNRDELDRLDRDTLVRRAEAAGVARARVLTRPELVDELLLRSATDQASRQKARGLFGRARDLIAQVVEQGLHLPDAAERIRAMGLSPPSTRATAPAALPTVTLAQIYVAQGHRERAIETLEKVLGREPEHAIARDLVGRLRDVGYPVPPLAMAPEREEEVASVGGDEEPPSAPAPAPAPRTSTPDLCSAALVEPTTLRVSWRVQATTLTHARRTLPDARVALCVHVTKPTWEGPRPSTTWYELEGDAGEFLARDLPEGCVVQAAVGCVAGARFASFAHSKAFETRAAVH
ncbi:MAG: hypothetical protein ACRENE_27375 [Polyangiaceae bacterium]